MNKHELCKALLNNVRANRHHEECDNATGLYYSPMQKHATSNWGRVVDYAHNQGLPVESLPAVLAIMNNQPLTYLYGTVQERASMLRNTHLALRLKSPEWMSNERVKRWAEVTELLIIYRVLCLDNGLEPERQSPDLSYILSKDPVGNYTRVTGFGLLPLPLDAARQVAPVVDAILRGSVTPLDVILLNEMTPELVSAIDAFLKLCCSNRALPKLDVVPTYTTDILLSMFLNEPIVPDMSRTEERSSLDHHCKLPERIMTSDNYGLKELFEVNLQVKRINAILSIEVLPEGERQAIPYVKEGKVAVTVTGSVNTSNPVDTDYESTPSVAEYGTIRVRSEVGRKHPAGTTIKVAIEFETVRGHYRIATKTPLAVDEKPVVAEVVYTPLTIV